MKQFTEMNDNLNCNKLADELLQQVVKNILNFVGESFFIAAVKNPVRVLQMEYLSVGRSVNLANNKV